MTQGQFEATSAEVLEAADAAAQALSVSGEVLGTVTASVQALAASAEVLMSSTLSTTEMSTLAVFGEVLIQSRTGSNIFDYTGTEYEAFQWTGTDLTPMTFVP